MGLALPDVCGYAPAKNNNIALTEIGLATGTLTKDDTHFGINGDVSSIVSGTYARTFKVGGGTGSYKLYRCGPRVIDLQGRGGDLAETLWQKWQTTPASVPNSSRLDAFLVTFDEVGGGRFKGWTNAPKSFAFSATANIGGDSVAHHQKYLPGATDKMMDSLAVNKKQYANADGTGFELGTRWSKVALEFTLINGGTVHFHLDGMGELSLALDKKNSGFDSFAHNHSVTVRELRYVYRNWARFKDHTVFYNGYFFNGSGYQAVIVDPPW